MTFTDHIVLAGDFNIRLERTTLPNVLTSSTYGLVQRVQGATALWLPLIRYAFTIFLGIYWIYRCVSNTSTTIVAVRYLRIEQLLFCVVTVQQLRLWTVLCYVHCDHDSQVQSVMFTVTSVSGFASSRLRRTVAYSSTAVADRY